MGIKRRLQAVLVITALPLTGACTGQAPAEADAGNVNIDGRASFTPELQTVNVEWFIVGSESAIPEEATVLISVATDDRKVSPVEGRKDELTAKFLDRVGEPVTDAVVTAVDGSGAGEEYFELTEREDATGLAVPVEGQVPRVHIGLVDDATDEVVATRALTVYLPS